MSLKRKTKILVYKMLDLFLVFYYEINIGRATFDQAK